MVTLASTSQALAHDGMGELGWRTSAHLLGAVLLVAAVYVAGLTGLWSRAGVGRGVSRLRAFAFAAGWLTLVVVLASPVDALAEQLASVHMLQHLALMLIAAPLMVAGAPPLVALWALPPAWRARLARRWRLTAPLAGIWRALSQPMLGWIIYFVVLWGWHLPALYEAALADPLVHDLQHLFFFGAAALVWWIILNPLGRSYMSGGAGLLYLFTTALHAMALGVFMTLSPVAWYATYEGTAPWWGWSALQDQQIAGAIMWMPAILAYVVLAALVFLLWIRGSELDARRLERIGGERGGRQEGIENLLLQAEEARVP